MSHNFLRGCALLLLGVGMLGINSAYAYHIECRNPKMTSLAFGNVDPQSTQTDFTATFSATCESDAPINPRAATICLSIGQPRQMLNGSATLNFELYKDPSHVEIWGSQFVGTATPVMRKIVLNKKEIQQVSATLYGRVLGGQLIPGTFAKSFLANNEARMTVDAPITGSTPPANCNSSPTGNLYFPFTVSATVIKKCTVTANPLDFGTSPGLLNTAMTASTTLGVQCSVGTAYNVGLSAGQNAGGDINARKMVLGSNSVGYQLYRDTARTQVWGNTEGSDTVPGMGNGTTTDSLTVYGTVPVQTTPPAGTYKDTVVVTVTY